MKKNKLKKTWKYLTKPSTKKKLKVGLVKSKAFFEGMSDGIDTTIGVDKRRVDYKLTNKRR
jgi:hypothetical protein